MKNSMERSKMVTNTSMNKDKKNAISCLYRIYCLLHKYRIRSHIFIYMKYSSYSIKFEKFFCL